MDPPCVRLRPIAFAIAVTCFLLFIVGPLVAAGVLLVVARWDVSIPVTLGAVAFVTLIGWTMSSSIQWVELDGWVIRGRRLFTRKIFELQVADIVGGVWGGVSRSKCVCIDWPSCGKGCRAGVKTPTWCPAEDR